MQFVGKQPYDLHLLYLTTDHSVFYFYHPPQKTPAVNIQHETLSVKSKSICVGPQTLRNRVWRGLGNTDAVEKNLWLPRFHNLPRAVRKNFHLSPVLGVTNTDVGKNPNIHKILLNFY